VSLALERLKVESGSLANRTECNTSVTIVLLEALFAGLAELPGTRTTISDWRRVAACPVCSFRVICSNSGTAHAEELKLLTRCCSVAPYQRTCHRRFAWT
jgi:hypothetical protein